LEIFIHNTIIERSSVQRDQVSPIVRHSIERTSFRQSFRNFVVLPVTIASSVLLANVQNCFVSALQKYKLKYSY